MQHHSGSIPAHQGPPASADPIGDFVRRSPPGLTSDGRYVVVPVEAMTRLELPAQQALAAGLDRYARSHAHLSWPSYRVTPVARRALTDCSEEQLAEVGVVAEHDNDELVYRDVRTLARIEHPEHHDVAVPCSDPVLGSGQPPPVQQAPPAGPPNYPPPPWPNWDDET